MLRPHNSIRMGEAEAQKRGDGSLVTGGTGGDDLISKAEDGRWEKHPKVLTWNLKFCLRKEEKKTSTQTTSFGVPC